MPTWNDLQERFKVGQGVTPALINDLNSNMQAVHEGNWARTQYTGAEANYTSTATNITQIGNLAVTMTTTGAPIYVVSQFVMQTSIAGYIYFSIQMDNDQLDWADPNWPHYYHAGSRRHVQSLWKPFPVSIPGTYTFRAYAWINSGGGTMTMISAYKPYILAIEGS